LLEINSSFLQKTGVLPSVFSSESPYQRGEAISFNWGTESPSLGIKSDRFGIWFQSFEKKKKKKTKKKKKFRFMVI